MPVLFWSLLLAGALFLASSLVTAGLVDLAGAELRLEDTETEDADVTALRIGLVVVLCRQLLLVAGIWALYQALAIRRMSFPFANRRWWPVEKSVFLWAIGTYVAVILYSALVSLLDVDWLTPSGTVGDEVTRDPLTLALAGILAVVVAPVSEELLFRGVIFGALSRFGIVVGALASGLLFALPHLDPGSIFPFTLVGAALAWVYYTQRSLPAAIYFHALFNSISFVLLVSTT